MHIRESTEVCRSHRFLGEQRIVPPKGTRGKEGKSLRKAEAQIWQDWQERPLFRRPWAARREAGVVFAQEELGQEARPRAPARSQLRTA